MYVMFVRPTISNTEMFLETREWNTWFLKTFDLTNALLPKVACISGGVEHPTCMTHFNYQKMKSLAFKKTISRLLQKFLNFNN